MADTRPMCVPCKEHMTCEKNDAPVLHGSGVLLGDLYGCPSCGHQIVTGFGYEAIYPHDQSKEYMTQLRAEAVA